MAKTEGEAYVQIVVGDKVVTKIVKSVHNDDSKETDRELTEQYGHEEKKKS